MTVDSLKVLDPERPIREAVLDAWAQAARVVKIAQTTFSDCENLISPGDPRSETRWVVATAQGLETDVRFRERLICNQRSFAVSVLKFQF